MRWSLGCPQGLLPPEWLGEKGRPVPSASVLLTAIAVIVIRTRAGVVPGQDDSLMPRN
jgi:hypothetical protein